MATESPDEILIIGAGPAGLACAMELARGGQRTTIVEKDDLVGGLAKTLIFQEGEHTFRTDLGPHRFFSKNQYLYDFIDNLIHEEWKLIPRLTRQFIDGKFYDYPVNAPQVFKNLGPFKSARMGLDYVYANLLYKMPGMDISTFEDYVVAHFGRSLAEFNMINYTEKIWGIPADAIHPDWAQQRILGLNLLSVLKTALSPKKGQRKPKSLVDQFYYPQLGTGLIYVTIAKRLKEMGNTVHTLSYPTKIHHARQRITGVDLLIGGREEKLRPGVLVESIPVTHFLNLMEPLPPEEVLRAAKALKWRAQLYLFITLDKPSITQDNWIYFPDKAIPFGRISEMKNFSERMSPEDKTSLLVEFFVFEGDSLWNLSKNELFELVLPYFEKMGFFEREEVRHCYLVKRRHVYPIYDLRYQEHLGIVKEYLEQFENLLYIGRPGRFKYTNQDHSLEMGIMAGRSILDQTKHDLEEIGAEHEYFEKGFVYEKRAQNQQTLAHDG